MYSLTMVNWLAVVVAAVVAMIIGFVWYSPMLFGNVMMEDMKSSKSSKKDMKKGMMKAMVAAFIAALISSWILASLIKSTQSTMFMSALGIGVAVWLGFYVTMETIRMAFSGTSMKLFLVNVIHHLIVVAAVCIVIVLIP